MDASSESVLEAAIASVQAALHYRFREPTRLRLALAVLAPPLTPEAAAVRQRLEFLGDAAWNYAVAARAFKAWPQGSAGALTRLRATCCSTEGLARLARRFGLPAPPGASDRALAELLEAILGAMVEDGGLRRIRFLAGQVISAARFDAAPTLVDPKSALQMRLQAKGENLPTYRLVGRRGPPHHPTFRIRVTLAVGVTQIRADAEGSSRQSAEQEAARLALAELTGGSPSG